tara:strand:- start:27 stop:674 length:648 start_codon:yes stop_codon:yes gene_type:complete
MNDTPFQTGGFFEAPKIAPGADNNGYWGTPTSYKVYMADINAATPNQSSLMSIGSETVGIPGPTEFGGGNLAPANVNTGRAANLSLCAQNMSTFSTGTNNGAIASSLLPSPVLDKKNMTQEGFGDSPTVNVLANQTFLSRQAGGQIGTNTTSGSLRNANLSIRSEPPNPMKYVGPWNLSSVYPDLLRRPLEGTGPSFGLYGNGPQGSGVPQKIGV